MRRFIPAGATLRTLDAIRMTPVQALPAELVHLLASRRGEIALFVCAVLLPFGAFLVLAATVGGSTARGWDPAILEFSERHYRNSIGSWLDSALEVGRVFAFAILVGAVIVLLKRRRAREALFCVLAVGGVLAADIPLKEMFHRPPWSPPRHEEAAGYSFPSGHAMASIAVVTAMTMISTRRWARRILILGVPSVLAVGVILVYSWWHYPSDVVAGWCLGLAWVTALWLAIGPRRGVAR